MRLRFPFSARFDPQYRISHWILAISGIIMVLGVLNKGPWMSTNALSRVISVERLVEKQTWAHSTPTDRSPFPASIDVVKVGDRIYSSKPPLYPLFMAGQAMAVKAVTGMDFYPHKKDYMRILLIVNQVLPYWILLWVAFLMLKDFTRDQWTINFMLLALGIGILPFAYVPTLNNHTLSAALFFIAFYLMYRITQKEDHRIGIALLAGVLLGYGVAVELPGGVFAVAFALVIFLHSPKLGVVTFIGIVLPLVPNFYVYHEISGHYKPFYLQGELYRFEGSYWQHPTGMDAIRHDRLTYIFHSTFGFRGLFLLTPLFLLVPGGVARLMRSTHRVMRREWIAILIGTAAILIFVWWRTQNYGGACVGMRWFMPFMPLLLLMAWPLVERLGKSVGGRVLCGFLFLLGLPWNLEVLLNDGFVHGTLDHHWLLMWGL